MCVYSGRSSSLTVTPSAMSDKRRLKVWRIRLLMFLAVIGPGFITANVDNDAGGIYTYSAAGVIVHVRGDEPRTDDGQEHQQADSPDFKPSLIGHGTGSYGER